MDGVTRAGFAGMQSGMTSAAEAAVRVTNSFQPESTNDGVGALVDLSRAAQQVSASAAVVRTGSTLQGALLDIFA